MLSWTLNARGKCRGLTAAGFLLALLMRPVCAASLSPEDLQILASALAFVQPRPAGEGVVAIVHAGQDSPSHKDAKAILALIGNDLRANGVVLRPKLVEANALADSEFSLVIVAAGANGEAVSRALRSRHALCVTADQAAVTLGLCTMAIRSTDKVEILLNYRAAIASGINLATAFRMMVSEL